LALSFGVHFEPATVAIRSFDPRAPQTDVMPDFSVEWERPFRCIRLSNQMNISRNTAPV